MTKSLKLLMGTGFLALTGVALATALVLPSKPTETASVAPLPERPPTFDELMVLADNHLAKNGLISSYIHSLPDGVGTARVIQEAATGDSEAELMACYLLISGIGVEMDKQRGYKLCETAAEKGSATAKSNLIYRDFKHNRNWQKAHDAFTDLLKKNPANGHHGLHSLYRPNQPKASDQIMRYHLKEAIKHDSTTAMHALAEFDFRGTPRYRNFQRGEQNLKKAYALNDFDAGYTLAMEYKLARYLDEDLEAYETIIKRLAGFLHPDSMSQLAYMYGVGQGVEKDEEKEIELHLKAAKFGSLFSQEMAGYHLLSGPIETQDIPTALGYLEAVTRKAGPKTRVRVMVSLSKHYGKSTVEDPLDLKTYWRTAAAYHGDENSQGVLSLGYMETGYIENMAPYIEALDMAASTGDVRASFLLARHYRAASGVDRDIRKAQRILAKVAHLGDPDVTEEIDVVEGYITHYGSIEDIPPINLQFANRRKSLR